MVHLLLLTDGRGRSGGYPDEAYPPDEAYLRDDVDRMLGRLVGPGLVDLAARLGAVATVSASERDAIHAAVATSLTEAVWRRVSRVVLLELNAARLTGTLSAPDPAARWREWVDRLSGPGGWPAVAAHYPALLPRLRTMIAHRCTAGLRFAHRFGADRALLSGLLPTAPGELCAVELGAGDSHRGGQSVTVARVAAGQVVYKPRSVSVDAVLGGFLERLLAAEPDGTRIRVPEVLVREDPDGAYGWAAHVPHRFCRNGSELRTFYRNLGHWLAVMRLLGGSDLHNENVVACGPVPVVVDCETLFTPLATARPSGYGDAVDIAVHRIGRSLLRTGLLPGRGTLLGWRGVDTSGAGFLPRQQPAVPVPTIVHAGTDRARLAMTTAVPPPARNLPGREPDLGRYWQCVVDGFDELTARLRALDRAGRLRPMVSGFAGCPVRAVLRDTAAYTELARMLWHPGSLHDPSPATRRAAELLVRHAANRPGAPDDPAVVDAEIAELLDGDVPMFVTTPAAGVMVGPRGARFGPARDLVAETLARWRDTGPATERQVLRAALVGAYLNDGWRSGQRKPPDARLRTGDLDRRRRAQAAGIMREISARAVRGPDGSATWVAPVMAPVGWTVRHLPADLYGGGAGVAVLLAGYQREVALGRADPVPDLADLLAAMLRTLRLADEQERRDRAEAERAGIRVRPEPPGGYLGLGSRIWAWLLLHRLAVVDAHEAVPRAEQLAALLPGAVAADREHDLVSGAAGAVVPVLRLAEHAAAHGTREPAGWRELARRIGQRLRASARFNPDGAGWPTEGLPHGIGGLSHGVTGIGWALSRLDMATGGGEFRELAGAAFAREESLFDPEHGGWRDARPELEAPRFGTMWCHGSVGIGIAAADLLAREGGQRWLEVLRRAALATWPEGLGWSSTLCHGDMSAWELLERARAAGVGPPGLDPDAVVARILSHLEEHGPVSGMARDAFSPGLLAGQGGAAYQLLRMHPASDLPSVLLPDPGPASPRSGQLVA